MKAKKCKGSGAASGYGCGQPQVFRKYGLGTECRCYQSWLVNSEAGQEKIKKTALNSRRKTINEHKKARREYYEQNKSIAKLLNEARVPFQKWIRMRDANDKCISCGKDSESWDAGHYLKAEIYSGLIFAETNCNKQCVYCNKWLDGNEANYRLGLLKKYGEQTVLYLEMIKDRERNKKWERQELIGIKNFYENLIKTTLKNLKNGN
jgi:hypothetical protein